MKTFITGMCAVLFFAAGGFCERAVVFIGLAGQGAPGIEKNITRLFGEHLATLPGVVAIDNDELKRTQARIGNFSYPTMTAPLAALLKRFAPDSALVVWGMVKSCTVRPVRRYFFTAAIRGDITLELTIYNLSRKAYAYCGEATATATVDKGFLFWFGPVENAVIASAAERADLMERLQEKAVGACGRILQAVLLNERSGKKQVAGSLGSGIEMRSVDVAPAPTLEKESPPQDSNASLIDTTGMQEPDSTTSNK
jgi:hypothetical protein